MAAQNDVEANRNDWMPGPLPMRWRFAEDMERGEEGLQWAGERGFLRRMLDPIKAAWRSCVGVTKKAGQAVVSFLWSMLYLTTEFYHPNASYSPRRLRWHLWYACLVLLNRPARYFRYFESFFATDQPPSNDTVRIDRTPVDVHGPGGASVYRRNISSNRTLAAESSGDVGPIPTMTAEREQEVVERWNTEVTAKIANDRDRYWRLNVAILLSSIASMQTPFISQSPLLMGNLFLIFAFSGLGCFSGWNRDLLDEMRTMKSIKQWEPLLLPSIDPAVVGNEFEFLALPEIYAVKAVLFTFILVLLAPFSYYGYPVELGGNSKLGFMVSWCIILVWGAISVVCGTMRMRAYGEEAMRFRDDQV